MNEINKDLISVEEAQKIIFSKFNSLGEVKKKLIDISGYVLAKEI